MKYLLKALPYLFCMVTVAAAQTLFPSGYPPANTILGTEVMLADQSGNPVLVSVNQIKNFIGTGTGCSPNCVTLFNGRSGAVSLLNTDVNNALGFIALNPANNLSELSNFTTARTNLGLGTAATQNTGSSGATLPLLNGNNTWSGTQTFSGTTISSRRTVNANTVLSPITDNFVCGDVSGGAITITLPPNTVTNGTTFGIDDCKRQSATHTLTIAANTGQTISGSATIAITTNGAAILAIWNSADSDWNLF